MNHPIFRLGAIGVVFVFASLAWSIYGQVLSSRSHDQRAHLSGAVAELWGAPQQQTAPVFNLTWTEQRDETQLIEDKKTGTKREITKRVTTQRNQAVMPRSSRLKVDLSLDERRKGLIWYDLYDVVFDGQWRYRHDSNRAATLELKFSFPSGSGNYDDFRFVVNGHDLARGMRPNNGVMQHNVVVTRGDKISLAVHYKSRGLHSWAYKPASGLTSLEDFDLQMTTDFSAIDYPVRTLSPSTRIRTPDGWKLGWRFDRMHTSQGIGMVMPERIQPGELAAQLAWSAPISLGFFFCLIWLLATLRRIDIHPINYILLAAAFFAFHLLFGYAVDHLDVVTTFVISSVTSVALVVSYLRLVVSRQFAWREAGIAQLVYLVGFSLAHFWQGMTGLTVTVLSIGTLFVVMQWTGRIRWSEVLANPTHGHRGPIPPPPHATRGPMPTGAE
ncbi:MAG: inner membrane CreD family protein [Myxococcales bacterium]|nr:inner membrane CreD family protein [Myxococcales bacterium]